MQQLASGTPNNTVLILDPDPARAGALAQRIRYLDFEPEVVTRPFSQFSIDQFQAVVVNDVTQSADLQEFLAELLASFDNIPVIYRRGDDDTGSLLDARKSGHAWTFDEPVRRSELGRLLKRAKRYTAMGPDRRRRISGQSSSVKAVREAIEQVAEYDTSVLIGGESGTGKELVARAIHDLSERADAPFVPLNCGAIQPELLESELFGHEKGAFTGAVCDRKGRLELAGNGTLFLDEIGDMSLPMQVKLLRVLQEREFRPVGSARVVKVACRIVAATHRDLAKSVEAGEFRGDLYYRLNVFPIKMPPLRKRVEDLPVLLEELMIQQQADGELQQRLSARALDALTRYAWPGNVRELSNLVERLAILNPTGLIDLEDLPEKYRQPSENTATIQPSYAEIRDCTDVFGEGVDLRETLVGVEIRLIRQALAQSGGTVAKAARLLKLQRTTLVEKIKKYRLNSDATSEI